MIDIERFVFVSYAMLPLNGDSYRARGKESRISRVECEDQSTKFKKQ